MLRGKRPWKATANDRRIPWDHGQEEAHEQQHAPICALQACISRPNAAISLTLERLDFLSLGFGLGFAFAHRIDAGSQ